MGLDPHEEEVNPMNFHPAKLAAGAFLVGLLGAGGMSLASAQTDPTTTQPPASTAPADPSTDTPPADAPHCHHGPGQSSDTSDTSGTTDSTDTAPTAPSASSSSSDI
jgi:hypothetical protein